MHTLRYAIRSLRRAPGFAILAILTIALGTGVNAAVFTIVHSVLLKSLPFREPGRLVRFNETKGAALFNLSYPNFKDWQRLNNTFDDMAIFTAFGNNPIKLPVGQMLVPTGATSWNLFSVLGVRPILGRTFRSDDDLGEGANLAVITYQAWEKYFNKDPQVLERQVTFFGQPIGIAGVLPQNVLLSGVEFWFPRGEVHNPNQLDRGNHPGFQGIGRLKPDVTVEQARADINGIAAALERQYPASNRGFRVRVLPLLEATVLRVKPMIWILFGAVGFVLLIACANVTNLLLVRSVHREREFALRTALGASTRQSMTLVLCESLVIAILGAAVGLAMADWGFLAILKIQPGVLPASRPVSVDPMVLAYSVALTLFCTLIFGLAPALRAARGNLTTVLKQGARGSSASPRTRDARSLLLAAEVALSITLVAGAGLMIRSLYALQHENLGFPTRNLMAAQIMLRGQEKQTAESVSQASYTYLDVVRALPGVSAVAGIWPLPENPNEMWAPTINFQDRPRDPGTEPTVEAAIVTPEYFKAMGIPLVRGRYFDAADLPVASSHVAIVSESYARQFYPGEDVIGRRVRMIGAVGVNGWKEIVGVVGDTRVAGYGGTARPQVYWPYGQILSQEFGMVIRAANPESLIQPLRRAIAAVDADTVLEQAETVDHMLSTSLADRRFMEVLLGIFASLALLLASIGVYGVVAFSVAQRTQEIGIRIALGASGSSVFRLVLRQTLLPVGAGLAVGLASAASLAPLLSTQIHGITPRDPAAFAGSLAVLAVVAAAAAMAPARRALRIDPIEAMRQE